MLAVAVNWQSIVSRVLWIAAVGGVVAYMLVKNKFSVEGIERIGKVLESQGGKLLTLIAFTIIFFAAALGMGYYVLEALENKTLTPDNAMATLIIQFVTGTAFGTVLGALINLLGSTSDKKVP